MTALTHSLTAVTLFSRYGHLCGICTFYYRHVQYAPSLRGFSLSASVLSRFADSSSYRSLTIACPCPPAAHAALSAYRLFSRTSRLAAVVSSLTPVAPKGCPNESEPPRVLHIYIATHA